MINVDPMKVLALLLAAMFFVLTSHAASECRNAQGEVIEQAQCDNGTTDATAKASDLPEEALAQVKELTVKMRYFKAIGFHAQSQQKRDEIAAIYNEHGVPLPDEYQQ